METERYDASTEELLKERSDYKYGFVTDVETDSIPKGLSEEVVRRYRRRRKSLNSCWNSA